MALILGYHVGEKIYFGDTPVKVVRSLGHTTAVLDVDGQEFEVCDYKGTEIMRGVYVSCGMPRIAREGGVALPRLVIDAPRDLVILREELYGRPKPIKPSRVSHPA